MPHASIKITSGVTQNETPSLNAAGISQSQLIRLKPDPQGLIIPEKLGGWLQFWSKSLAAYVKALWAWQDTNGGIWAAAATNNRTSGAQSGQAQLAVMNCAMQSSGYVQAVSFTDITPQQGSDSVAVDFATTTSSPIVSITDATTTGITSVDVVYVVVPVSIGGIVISGMYQCITGSNTQYEVQALDIFGNPLAASYTVSGGITATGGSSTGSTVTLSWATPNYTFPVGSAITVSGVTPSGWNGTSIVTTSTPTSVTYNNTSGGSYSSGGSITNNGVVPLLSTTNGSNVVTVTFPNHNFLVGQTFSVLIATTVGGMVLNGNYAVASVTNSYTFTFLSTQSATSTASGYVNGGKVAFIYSFGINPSTPSTGYGIGGYGQGGYGVGSPVIGGVGTNISASTWSLDNWGQQLIASPVGNYPIGAAPTGVQFQPIYVWDPTAGYPIATVIPQAPTISNITFVAMPQRQIVSCGSTFTGEYDPLLVRWCDVQNYTVWIAQVTNQAGSYRIPRGSSIVGAMQAPQQGLIWTNTGVWSMQYIGLPYVYSFNELGRGCGLIAMKAAGILNGVVYWMGFAQFFTFGASSASGTTGAILLPCPIWDVVFQNLDLTSVDSVVCAPNSLFNEITWYFPPKSGMTTPGQTLPTNYVRYNALLGQWDFGTLTRTAWTDVTVISKPLGTDENMLIQQHEVANDANGQILAPSFTTGYFAISEGDSKIFVDQWWPDMKWAFYNASPNATIQLTFNVCDYPGDTPQTFGPYTINAQTKYISPRFRGRLVSLTFAGNDLGTFWRMGLNRYRWNPDGKF